MCTNVLDLMLSFEGNYASEGLSDLSFIGFLEDLLLSKQRGNLTANFACRTSLRCTT